MSAASIAAVIASLQVSGSPFAIVEGATEFATVSSKRPTASPAAFVLVKEEAGGENERMTGGTLQRLEADLAVVIFTENVSDPIGGGSGSDLEALKDYARGQLVGLEPAGAVEPMEFISGELLAARGGGVWHEEIYSLVTYLEKN